jgi:cyclic pyranopterin phosphate synthase
MSESARMLGAGKMFHHLDRLAAWQRGELPPPVTVELNLTNRCNHACGGCSFGYLVNVSQDSLPAPLAVRLIEELAGLGVKAITFSGGGEPLVYGEPRVLSLMEMVKDAGMDCALITNGSLLRSERFLDLCEWVRVSLDAYDAETFQRFHGRGEKEFEKVVGNLHDLGVRKSIRAAPSATLGVGFLTTAESLERGDFDRMAAFCATLPGLDYLQFRPLVENMVARPALDGGYAAPLDLAPWQAAYDAAALQYSRPDFRVLWSEGKYAALALAGAGRTYEKCHAHFLEATVGADGRVAICCHGQGVDDFTLGSLHEQTFAEIWHGERARRVYERIDPRVHCPPACRLSGQNAVLQDLLRPAEHPNFI